jgi:dynein heavy chain, axonemal
VNIHGLFF